MRTFLCLAPIALAFAPPADACGPVPPRVYLMSSYRHYTSHGHTLVRLAQPVNGAPAWQQADPMSYDSTAIAPASPLAAPMTVTLVGEHGTREVRTRDRVLVQHDLFRAMPASVALDLGEMRVDFPIAVDGPNRDLGFVAPVRATATAADAVWLQTAEKPDMITKTRIADVDTFVLWSNGGPSTTVRFGDRNLGTFAGTPIGALDESGDRYLLIDHNGAITPIPM
jgi:hypothetical protein